MSTKINKRQSVPALQLYQMGTTNSFGIQMWAVQTLSNSELKGLEDDLDFFDRTGVVGIYLSRILKLLWQNMPTTEKQALAA